LQRAVLAVSVPGAGATFVAELGLADAQLLLAGRKGELARCEQRVHAARDALAERVAAPAVCLAKRARTHLDVERLAVPGGVSHDVAALVVTRAGRCRKGEQRDGREGNPCLLHQAS